VLCGAVRNLHPVGFDTASLARAAARTARKWGTGVDFDLYCPSQFVAGLAPNGL
jgi:hypothetical protein